MKLNMKTIKVLFAFVIIIGTIFWAANTARPRFYDGTNLNFSVGSGTVSVTNLSDQTTLVQLVGSGTRSFSISSTIEGVSGSSTRQGSGSSSTHLYEFGLPSGTSEFTVARGTNVTFVASTSSQLEATVNPVTDSTLNAIVVATTIVVLGALFYASRVTEHFWFSWLQSQVASGKDISNDDTAQAPVVADGGQGRATAAYGDSRTPR